MKKMIARLFRFTVAAGLCCSVGWALAQSASPPKNLRIVVGYPSGQTTDTLARSFAAVLARHIGRPVYVDNKAGANGILGAQEVARAAPDGATLLLAAMSQMAVNPSLYKKLPYDPEKDFTPIALVGVGPLVVVANPSFPPNNLTELIAYAKKHPDKINYASGGTGITGHLAMEILQSRAGIKLNHIPYKGSPAAMTDVIGGQVELMVDPLATTLPQIRAGKVKALAVTGNARRTDVGQDVGTLDEQGLKGLEIQSWVAFFAPGRMDATTAQALGEAVRRATESQEVRDTFRNAGIEPIFVPPAKLAPFLHEEIEKWGKAVRNANIQID